MSTTNLIAQVASWSIHQLRLFFIALQFFTRIPIPQWVGFEEDWLQHAVRYFVLVGVLIGAVTGVIYYCAVLIWPPLIAVLLSTIAGIVLTGAFHEDGFADTCDGLGGAVSAERALDIMKDSRIGAYGAIGIMLMLAMKIATLILLPVSMIPSVLLVVHPLSRLASCSLIWRLQYVRAEGKAKPLAQRMTTGEWITGLFCVLAPMLICLLFGSLHWQSLLLASAMAALATVWLARVFVQRLGGYTGDCLGAVQQLAELGFYLGAVAALRLA